MEKEIKNLLKEVLNEKSYATKIKETLTQEIINAIRWDFDEIIKESIKEMFDEKYKTEIAMIIEKEKETLKEILTKRIKECLIEIANNLVLKPSYWEFEKVIRDGITLKGNK